MPERHSIVLVNYLNTLPFLVGLKTNLSSEVDLLLAHPADCARTFFSGRVDFGLVPVGALIGRSDWRRVGHFGIGCHADVATVCLFGHTPMEEWDTVLLDYQSRTSVLLARILLQEHWKKQVSLAPSLEGYEMQIAGRTGGLVIGDRAIRAKDTYAYCYDLGEAWRQLTGLPFVFALWVSRDPHPASIERQLDEAFRYGMTQIQAIAEGEQYRYPDFDLKHYYERHIAYQMTPDLLEGWDMFQKMASILDH